MKRPMTWTVESLRRCDEGADHIELVTVEHWDAVAKQVEDLQSKLLRAVEEGCEWKRKYEEAINEAKR